MPGNSKIAAVVIAVSIAVTLIGPFASTITGSTGVVSVSGDVDADTGNYQEIEGYDIDTSNITATDSGGTTLTQGTDYELNATDGTIKFLSGGSVSSGDQVDLDYSYQATDGTTTTITGLLPVFLGLLILVPIANEVTNRL